MKRTKLPNGLTQVQDDFVREYEVNGNIARRAYSAVHPKASATTAASEGYKCLRKPQVQAELKRLREARWKRVAMAADEAVALTSERARADIRQLYDDDGQLLPKRQWPRGIAQAVKSVKDGMVVLESPGRATELVLQMHGKLKNVLDVHNFDHVGLLAARQRAYDASHGKDSGAGADSSRDEKDRQNKRAR